MNLNKVNMVLEYEFILKHKNLKEYFENYLKYKNELKYKYDLYSLVYIDSYKNIIDDTGLIDLKTNNNFYWNDNEIYNTKQNELFIYLGIDNNKHHIFICSNLSVNLVYNEMYITEQNIDNKSIIINKVNMPNEIYQKYIKCLTDTYEIVGY